MSGSRFLAVLAVFLSWPALAQDWTNDFGSGKRVLPGQTPPLAATSTFCPAGNPKSQTALLFEFQSCAAQGLPQGCITPNDVQDLICSVQNLSLGGLTIGQTGPNVVLETDISGNETAPVNASTGQFGTLVVGGVITANNLSAGTVVSGGWLGLDVNKHVVLGTPGGGGGSSGVVDWVSITNNAANGGHTVDPTGVTDSTAGIQAAIDYAYAHNNPYIYCPAGTYKTSDTIWLDPPNNMRVTKWSGTGYISGTTLTITSTASGTLAAGKGNYIHGAGVTGATIITGGAGPYTVNNSQTLGSAGSPVALTASIPTGATQSIYITGAFFGDPSAGAQPGNAFGCVIAPVFNNAPVLMVGTGQGMRVSDFSVVAPSGNFCGQPQSGIGIGFNGNTGGSHVNLAENTSVYNLYIGYASDAGGWLTGTSEDLNDSNTWRKVTAYANCIGILLYGSQSFINDIVEPNIYATEGINNLWSHQVNVYGGNISRPQAASNTFSISNTGSYFQSTSGGVTCPGGSTGVCFSTTVASPDTEFQQGLYTGLLLNTPAFGVIPLTLLSWNNSTNVAVLGVNTSWVSANYGNLSGPTPSGTALETAITAATTLYAADRVIAFYGTGFTVDGTHIEDNQSCASLLVVDEVWSGQQTNDIRNIFADYDTSQVSYGNPTIAYCQLAYPFIGFNVNNGYTVRLMGGSYGYLPTIGSGPITIDVPTFDQVHGDGLVNAYFNVRAPDVSGCGYGQSGNPNGLAATYCPQIPWQTVARGGGQWDQAYWLPVNLSTFALSTMQGYANQSDISAEFCGYEPCPWTISNLTSSILPLVCPGGNITSCNTLGALGTYPPIACRTVFKSVDWNTGSLSHLWLRSASCPGYSYGQNLTDTIVGAGRPGAVINGSIAITGTPITWNTSTAPSGWTFSNGNLTGAYVANDVGSAIKGTAACATTKPDFKITVSAGNEPSIGLANPSQVQNDIPGFTTNAVGWISGGGIHAVYVNGSSVGTIGTYGSGDTVELAFDETSSPVKMWGRINSGNWNGIPGAVPGDSNGISLTGLVTTGGLLPIVGDYYNVTYTAQFKGFTPPAGFQACDQSAVTLTVNSVTSGTVAVGQLITGAGVSAGTYIQAPIGLGETIATQPASSNNIFYPGFAQNAAVSSSLYYWENIVNGTGFANNESAVGLGNTSSSTLAGAFLGNGTDTLGIFANGVYAHNDTQLTGLPGFGTTLPVLVCEALDTTHNKLWVRYGTPSGGCSGNWDGSGTDNPATNTGGISLTQTGWTITSAPIVPAFNLYYTGDTVTALFASSSWKTAPPSGFGQLPTVEGWNPSQTGSGVVLGYNTTTYPVNIAQTVSSEALTLYSPLTYSGTRYSDVLNLDANTLSWMFPGLGITLGSDKYTVTGVYPYPGYVTVIAAASAAGGPLSSSYSCTQGCTIGQAAFAWTAY